MTMPMDPALNPSDSARIGRRIRWRPVPTCRNRNARNRAHTPSRDETAEFRPVPATGPPAGAMFTPGS